MSGTPERSVSGAPQGVYPREQRVRKRAEFLEIQSRGRRVNTSSFMLVMRAREPSVARLGITVSRRIGNAVVRNRVKRLVREAFRATRTLWAADIDLVVIVRRARPAATLQEVVAEWQGAAGEVLRRTEQARKDRVAREAGPAETHESSGT